MDDLTRRQLLIGSLVMSGAVAAGTLSQGWGRVAPSGAAKAPELIGVGGDWLNTSGKPLKLYGAEGLLSSNGCILVDFWEYTCVNCIRTMPYLREWDRRYRDKGLTIIGIHTPEFAFAKLKDNVSAAAKRFQLTYPILIDSNYANWTAYDNHFWPRKYLLDRNGRIVYDHAGEGGYGETEEKIQELLRAARPGLSLPKIMEPIRGADKPGAVCYRQTPELYAGYERGTPLFGSPGGFRRGFAHTYTDPGTRKDGLFYAKGRWRSLPESLRHARATTDPFEDHITLSYMALEVNAVMRPEGGKPYDVFIEQDGRPVSRESKGADIRYTPDGRSYVRVDAPRMYALIVNKKFGKHELRVGSASPDFGLYAFTFSSCEIGGTS